MRAGLQVVVVGGGVAGSAAAVALRRIGAGVTVYEAHPEPGGPVGSFVSLAVNGLRGLDALGCLPAVQQAGFSVAHQRMWSGAGKLLGEVPRGRPAGEPLQSVTLLRAELVAAVRDEAIRAGAAIHTGERIASLDDARLAGADLVVGADGIWSETRKLLDPVAPRPEYTGLVTSSGQSAGPGLPDVEPGTFNMILARAGAFLYLPAPDGSIWWSAQIAAPQPPDQASIGPAELAEHFAGTRQAVAVLAATRDLHGGTLNHVLAEVSHRHDDRTVLIGDAAHPVGAGQGAAMAIEDAVVLAREVHRAATIPAALESFDTQRGQRLGKLARMATANRDAKTAGPVATRLRNLVMPLTFPRFYPRATGWLYSYDVGTLPVAIATGPR